MAPRAGRFTKDLEKSEEFYRKEKPDVITNTAKRLYQRAAVELPHCEAMQLSHGQPSDSREGRGFTCQQVQQPDLKQGSLMHADTHPQGC